MENVRKQRDIKLLITDRRISHIVLEPNHTTKWFSENLLVIEKNKTEVKMKKQVYLGTEDGFLKYGDNANVFYTNTDSFIAHAKSEHVYADLAGDVER